MLRVKSLRMVMFLKKGMLSLSMCFISSSTIFLYSLSGRSFEADSRSFPERYFMISLYSNMNSAVSAELSW